ncbi:MAG: DUF1670 domain-containing protein [Candidatus Hodarchaeales archaeon]|jgi:hypothetical protein
MIISNEQRKDKLEDRLKIKTLDNIFFTIIKDGTNCSAFEAKTILENARRIYRLDNNLEDKGLSPGQLKVIGIDAKEPAGKPLSDCEKKEATVTLDAGSEDHNVRFSEYWSKEQGVAALRRFRLARIAQEACDQGVLLTQEDLAFRYLNCSVSTIRRDVRLFRKLGIAIPTRGQQKDIGRGTTHRVEAVKRFILGKPVTLICREIFHSPTSVERYITTFSRVIFLLKRGFSPEDISFAIKVSLRLVEDYIRLINELNTDAYKDKLDEIANLSNPFFDGDIDEKKKFKQRR